jgi:DNA-binding SARP family transcriptional activator
VTEVARLRLFGEFALEDVSGRPISLHLRKAEALLVYLALRPAQSASRERLATLLWGDSDQQRARQSLRQVLFALSRAFAQLELPLLHVESQAVRLSDGAMVVDAVEFDRLLAEGSPKALREACDLYTGEFLAGFGVEATEFEEWITATREMFRDGAMRALCELLNEQESAQQLDRAIETAGRALRVDALREDVHRQLMRLYAAKGMRSSALSQYRNCRQILERELGVPPDEETSKLYRQILEQDGEAPKSELTGDPVAPGGEGLGFHDRIEQLAAASDGIFVGRERHLARLQTLMDEVGGGGGRLAFISGDPGVGKTELLSVFARWAARSGALVLMARGRRTEQALPFELWSEALDVLSASAEDEDQDGAAGEGLPRKPRLPGALPGGAGATAADPRAVYETVVTTLRDLARERLVVLLFDDLQSADAESLRLLAYAMRSLRGAKILTVAASVTPTAAREPLLRALLREFDRDGLLIQVELEPLSQDDTVELAWQLQQAMDIKRDSKAQLRKFWHVGEGNPRVIRAAVLAATRQEDGGRGNEPPLPMTVLDEVAVRKIRLGEAAQQLMSVAAVIGRRAEFRLLVRAAEMEEGQAADAVEELVAERILAIDGEDLVFVYRRIALAVYEELLRPRRKLLHRAVARALVEIHAGELELHYHELARHAREGGDVDKALLYAFHAGQIEMNRGAPAAARRFFQEALDAAGPREGDRKTASVEIDAHLALAALAEMEEGRDEAAGHLEAAEALATRHGEPRQISRLHAARSRLAWVRGDEAHAYELARRALRRGGASDESLLWRAAEQLPAYIHLTGGAGVRAIDRMKRRLARCTRLGLRQDEADAAAVLGLLHAVRGEFEPAARYCESAVEVAETIMDESFMAACLQTQGLVECWRGDSRSAVATFEKALEKARARGDLPRLHLLTGFMGYALLVGGRDDEALVALRAALDMGRDLGTDLFAALFAAWLAEGSVGAVGDEEALRLDREALDRASRSNQPWARSVALRALARTLIRPAYRDLHAADHAVRQAEAIQSGLGLRCEAARTLIVHAKILRARGNARRSSEIFTEAGNMFARMGLSVEFDRARTMAEALRPDSGRFSSIPAPTEDHG